MFAGVHMESNFQSQAGLTGVFSKMNEILNKYAPQEENKYSSKGIHPMISVNQAAQELLEMIKQNDK
jgi:hypothetical protein